MSREQRPSRSPRPRSGAALAEIGGRERSGDRGGDRSKRRLGAVRASAARRHCVLSRRKEGEEEEAEGRTGQRRGGDGERADTAKGPQEEPSAACPCAASTLPGPLGGKSPQQPVRARAHALPSPRMPAQAETGTGTRSRQRHRLREREREGERGRERERGWGGRLPRLKRRLPVHSISLGLWGLGSADAQEAGGAGSSTGGRITNFLKFP